MWFALVACVAPPDDSAGAWVSEERGCPADSVFSGNIWIEGNFGRTTVGGSLSALSEFTEVDGDLTIMTTEVTAFEGLECLRTITGDLWIAGNGELESLAGLDALETVGSDLIV